MQGGGRKGVPNREPWLLPALYLPLPFAAFLVPSLSWPRNLHILLFLSTLISSPTALPLSQLKESLIDGVGVGVGGRGGCLGESSSDPATFYLLADSRR